MMIKVEDKRPWRGTTELLEHYRQVKRRNFGVATTIEPTVTLPSPPPIQPLKAEAPPPLPETPKPKWVCGTAPVPIPATRPGLIMNIVSERTRIPRDTIRGDVRIAPVTRARMLVYWLCRKHTVLSLHQIGRLAGGKDHTSVLHGFRKIEQLRNKEPGLDEFLDILTADLEQAIEQNQTGGHNERAKVEPGAD